MASMTVRYDDSKREQSFRAKQLILDAFKKASQHLKVEEVSWDSFLSAAYALKLVFSSAEGVAEPAPSTDKILTLVKNHTAPDYAPSESDFSALSDSSADPPGSGDERAPLARPPAKTVDKS